jgi:SNF2 family DNA or RNA helicase
MNASEFLLSLQRIGLRLWQANFIVSFLESNSADSHLLTAPPETGKSYTSIAIAAEMTSRGAERLLVSAPAPLCEEWCKRLGDAQSKLPVVHVTRRIYREMEAAVSVGECPLKADAIYVISQALLNDNDIFDAITSVVWDVVIVDEAHRIEARQRTSPQNRKLASNVSGRPHEILEELLTNHGVRRLLLLSATPLATLEPWLRPSLDHPAHLWSSMVATNWYGALKNWDGSTAERQPVEWSVVSYRRNSDEVKFLSNLLSLSAKFESKSDAAGASLRSLMLIFRASSSIFAIEQSLERIRISQVLDAKVKQAELILGPLDPILDSTVEGSTVIGGESSAAQTARDFDIEEVESITGPFREELADVPNVDLAVQHCLDALDYVSADEKLNALRRLIQSIVESKKGTVPAICIFTRYADTAEYLNAALEDVDLPLFKLTGRIPFAERKAVVDSFLRDGGVLIGTDAAMSEGVAMPQVAHVVHYDLPSNSLAVEQRCSRFDRFGRTEPLTMYLLDDESGVLAFESRLIQDVVLNRGIDADIESENPTTT